MLKLALALSILINLMQAAENDSLRDEKKRDISFRLERDLYIENYQYKLDNRNKQIKELEDEIKKQKEERLNAYTIIAAILGNK